MPNIVIIIEVILPKKMQIVKVKTHEEVSRSAYNVCYIILYITRYMLYFNIVR